MSRSLLREFIHDHAAALLLFALVMVAACPVRCAEAQEMSRRMPSPGIVEIGNSSGQRLEN